MSDTSYNVRIWKTRLYVGQRATTYYVRWVVAGRERKQPFKGKALAESFRAELVTAARKGEAFDVVSGLPVSVQRASRSMTWYELACAFVDMKWPRVAATTRRTHAEALTAITSSMLTTTRGQPDDKLIRKALCRWAFNTNRRNDPNTPDEVREALRWVAAHTRGASDLARPEVLRPLLDNLTVRLDGGPAAASVVNRRRKIFNGVVEYAVELKLLSANPLPALKWKRSKSVYMVDRRVVANPVQVRTLLEAVREQGRSGPRMVAFYACLYFAAMRPEEAAALAKHHIELPEQGWGQFHLDGPSRTPARTGPTAGTTATGASSSSASAGRPGPRRVRRN